MWITIHPFVHMEMGENRSLLYNTLNGELVEFMCSAPIFPLLKQLYQDDALRVARLDQDSLLSDPLLAKQIEKLRSQLMIDVLPILPNQHKPVQLVPYSNLQGDVFRLKKLGAGFEGERVLKYLTELTVFLTNRTSVDRSIYDVAYRQFPFPLGPSKKIIDLDQDALINFLGPAPTSSLNHVNLVGGNPFLHPAINDIEAFITDELGIQVEYMIRFSDWTLFAEKILSRLSEHIRVIILATSRELESLESFPIFDNLLSNPGIELRVLIESLEGLSQAEMVVTCNATDSVLLVPFATRDNQSFIRDLLCFSRKDITEHKMSQNEIHARSIINMLDFGKLTVLFSGTLHGNVNDPFIGQITETSLQEAVLNELVYGCSWLRTRAKIKPCCDCLYQSLCPPPTNYERILGELCSDGCSEQ